MQYLSNAKDYQTSPGTLSHDKTGYGGIAVRLLGVEKVAVSTSGLGYVFIDQSAKEKFIRERAIFFYRLGLSNKKVGVIFQNTTDRELFLENKIIEKSQAILIRGSGVDLHDLIFKAESGAISVVMFLARQLKDKGILEFVESSRIVKKVRQIWREHSNGSKNWSSELWKTLMFQSWLESQNL